MGDCMHEINIEGPTKRMLSLYFLSNSPCYPLFRELIFERRSICLDVPKVYNT